MLKRVVYVPDLVLSPRDERSADMSTAQTPLSRALRWLKMMLRSMSVVLTTVARRLEV